MSFSSFRERCHGSWWLAIATALILMAVAYLPLTAQTQFIRSNIAFTAYGGVLLATYLGGRRCGILATALSTLIILAIVTQYTLAVMTFLVVGFLFALILVELVARMGEAQARAEAAAQESRTLFLELRHRVANDLQMVAGLLMLHQANIQDRAAAQVISEAADRVRLIGKINRDIYDSGSTAVAMTEFLPRLCADLASTLTAIPIDCRVLATGQRRTARTLLPLSLIIQELIANAVEHGFEGAKSGHIVVKLEAVGERGSRFTVEDDGRGFPENFDPLTSKSLGLKLVRLFAKQLKADLRFAPRPGGGTVASVELPSEEIDGSEEIDLTLRPTAVDDRKLRSGKLGSVPT
jgi:two-component sensor histidine kinase